MAAKITAQEAHDRIARALRSTFNIDSVRPQVYLFNSGSLGDNVAALEARGERWTPHGMEPLFRSHGEDDDWPEFVGRAKVIEVATAALAGTGWSLLDVRDSEKHWFEIRFAIK